MTLTQHPALIRPNPPDTVNGRCSQLSLQTGCSWHCALCIHRDTVPMGYSLTSPPTSFLVPKPHVPYPPHSSTDSCYGTVMEAAGANWIVACYKSIGEDVKRCTANGFIVVGDRKWWSTLSDSLACLIREGKFVRRSCTFTIVPTVDAKLQWQTTAGCITSFAKFRRNTAASSPHFEREHSSIGCHRRLIISRP